MSMDYTQKEGGEKGAPAAGLPSVPWGVGKIIQVMVLWLLAYIIIGQVQGKAREGTSFR